MPAMAAKNYRDKKTVDVIFDGREYARIRELLLNGCNYPGVELDEDGRRLVLVCRDGTRFVLEPPNQVRQ
jgi:hypothetical protein